MHSLEPHFLLFSIISKQKKSPNFVYNKNLTHALTQSVTQYRFFQCQQLLQLYIEGYHNMFIRYFLPLHLPPSYAVMGINILHLATQVLNALLTDQRNNGKLLISYISCINLLFMQCVRLTRCLFGSQCGFFDFFFHYCIGMKLSAKTISSILAIKAVIIRIQII